MQKKRYVNLVVAISNYAILNLDLIVWNIENQIIWVFKKV